MEICRIHRLSTGAANRPPRGCNPAHALAGGSVRVSLNTPSLDTLDQILLDLPIMKEHGEHVQVEVTPLRRFEDFATDVKKRLE